jgi:excisionase family DNA binding protein
MHPRTIYKLVKNGSIPGKKFGGGWRFSRREIMQMISPIAPAARPQSDDLEGR